MGNDMNLNIDDDDVEVEVVEEGTPLVESKDIVEVPWGREIQSPTPAPVRSVAELLIDLAKDPGVDTAKLQQLIDMKNQEEDRVAQKEFEEAFAKMHADFPGVTKNTEGYQFKYAPIEVLQEGHDSIIAAHGFHYFWTEEAVPDKPGWKRVVLHICGFGHERMNHFDVPPIEPTAKQTAVQLMGTQSTYGQRYTYKAGFAILIRGEDTDGAPVEEEDTSEAIKALKAASDLKGLHEEYRRWYPTAATDPARKAIIAVKDKRKAELQAATNNAELDAAGEAGFGDEEKD